MLMSQNYHLKCRKMTSNEKDLRDDQDFEQAFTQALSKICSLTVESLLLSNSLFAQRLRDKTSKNIKNFLPARGQPAASPPPH